MSPLGLARQSLSDYRFGRLLQNRMTIGPDSFSPIVVPIVNCYGDMNRHSEVVSTAMLLFSELLNCDSMLA